MIRRILCIFLIVLLLAATAAAEPRYPDQDGLCTDAAAVLSASVLEDLDELDDRLDDADVPRLYIATVDFLDGSSVEDYADALFHRWHLDDDEVLLLIAVGEESFATACGSDAALHLTDELLSALLDTDFRPPFLAQRYDEAVASFAIALVKKINSLYRVGIRTGDLFRSASGSLYDNWNSMLHPADPPQSGLSFLTREDRASGFSVLKVLLIIVLLLLVFGSFRKGRRMAHPYAPNPGAKNADGKGAQPRH